MKVLVIGSGGREHALCWKLAQSPKVERLYCAPGNAGTAAIAQNINIKIGETNYLSLLVDFAVNEEIDLTVVGPEMPLAEGIVDLFIQRGLRIFGPNRQAAQLESSKVFAKEFMKRYHIPTAGYKIFDEYKEARDYFKKVKPPIVIKVDGLAQGKGTFVCQRLDEAERALEKIMIEKCFGPAGERIVIEEFLEGKEVSFQAFTDGQTFIPLATSCDHKRVYDGDEGPNTGGMGAYSPAPLSLQLQDEIKECILRPTIEGLLSEGYRFVGVIYLGLMITKDGPKVLEYNVRFGDPEAQVVLPRLKSDLVLVLEACLEERLHEVNLEWDDRAVVCVVLASGGYPGEYKKGKEIKGLAEVAGMKDIIVFHAGTVEKNGQILTDGGRVLGVTSYGDGIEEAIIKVYQAVEKIYFEGCHFRKDIGHRIIGEK